ncbi:WXG100 family type VII secretion target [Nocardioides sp. BP30]|uniref:WXG100 family type VII secretion target n=1 Tax=Nocardioides sp. BP30 TaxID=3036374 RepID=UPI002469AAD5|nr:WXG100 family type VII secretion target [Nocardioides sp. BP30]WGL52753.1 WXG100 family type VII secretion target [Nocardioides sp. BP30]
MSDGTIRVAGADLEQMATDMKTANSSIQSRLDDLKSNLEKIFGAGWEGQSREAFDTAHAQWTTQIADMQQIMTDAHNNVLTSRENYAAGDKKAAGFF